MHYKIILSNTNETISIQDDEIEKVLSGLKKGTIVITKNGVFNSAYFVALIVDKDRGRLEAEMKQYHYKVEEPSPFAKLLSGKMKMLPDKERTEVDEEVAKMERKSKI